MSVVDQQAQHCAGMYRTPKAYQSSKLFQPSKIHGNIIVLAVHIDMHTPVIYATCDMRHAIVE